MKFHTAQSLQCAQVQTVVAVAMPDSGQFDKYILQKLNSDLHHLIFINLILSSFPLG